MMILRKFFVVFEELDGAGNDLPGGGSGGAVADAGGGSAGGDSDFDMESAVKEVGEGLFGSTDKDEPKAPVVAEKPPTPVADKSASATVAQPPKTPDDGKGIPLTREDGTPKTWKAEAAAVWQQIPEVARQEILRREADIFKGLEAQKPLFNFGRTMAEVLQPYEQVLREHNINPVAQVKNLMNAHYTLALGTPEQKAALMRDLVRDYQIDPSTFGGQAAADDDFIDPQVKALQQTIGSLQSELRSMKSGLQQERQAETQALMHAEIEKFSKSPDAPYFPQVHKQMSELLRAGAAKDLQEAYNKAVWLVPEVAEKLIAERTAKEVEKAQKEAQQRVQKARNLTTGSVRSEGRTGGDTATVGSMDDTMQETLEAIRKRG